MSSEVEKTPVTIDDVDPFIGIDGPGATLCGPYHPLGLVRLGPDTVAPQGRMGIEVTSLTRIFSYACKWDWWRRTFWKCQPDSICRPCNFISWEF